MNMKASVLSTAVLSALSLALFVPARGDAASTAAVRAQGLIAGKAAGALVHRADADAFTARDVITDADGTEHVRFERTYRGLPVIGGDVVTHSRNGVMKNASQSLRTSLRPALTGKLSQARAITEAGARFGTGFKVTPHARLVVYALGPKPVLAHEVVFSGMRADQTPTEMHYFVDANSGAILGRWDAIQTIGPGPSGCTAGTAAAGTGKTLSLGNVRINTQKCNGLYRLVDTTRGGGTTENMARRSTGTSTPFADADNTWGNNTNSDTASAAAEAHFAVATTWDYFKTAHNRSGIAGDGRGALSRVHYGRKYANAFWSDACFCMTFGDGDDGVTTNPLTTLDISGHEMSHGVTSRTAGLVYEYEPGGLNEATSDIFGTMVEYQAANASDPGDYTIGEEIYPSNRTLPAGRIPAAIRFMFKPSLDGYSADCYYADLGGLDVHFSSGVANHFYYLLAEGSVVPAGFGAGTQANLSPQALVCGATTANLKGIGRTAAAKIWYRALTVYMTSGSKYVDARVATQNAANDLYGNGSTQAKAVAAAWSAVGVM